MTAWLLLLLSVGACAQTELNEEVRRAVQPILDRMAIKYNTSFSYGLRGSNVGIGLVAGDSPPVTPSTLFPSGSVTKPYTAMAIIQLAERGLFSLDSPAAPLANPVLQKQFNTTLNELWGFDERMNRVTVRHLLRMRSGIQDYNNLKLELFTLNNPGVDYTPYDMLKEANKTFSCEPGECGLYSSVGYNILGLILASQTGKGTWDSYDQRSVFPGTAPAGRYSHTLFPLHGACSAFNNVLPHQYGYGTLELYLKHELVFYDLAAASCLNGWTCGNLAATPLDIATFLFDAFQGNIVLSENLEQMVQFEPLTEQWGKGILYGLGLMYQGSPPVLSGNATLAATIGHDGMDYGSQSTAAYNYLHKFAFSLATASSMGKNCSFEKISDNRWAAAETGCLVYDAVLQIIGGSDAPRLNCSKPASPQEFRRGAPPSRPTAASSPLESWDCGKWE
eukprot:Sspe_Gene.94401::Locus_66790_Transcript_1_1_Confidence_1.000_Length_1503::g.94401::m.94401